MEKKIVCKCDCSQWRFVRGIVYTSYPPINADIYECVDCGETYEKRHKKQSIEDLHPVSELFEEE